MEPTLTPIQLQVLDLLVQGYTITAAAQHRGLHRTTIHNWRREDPDFAQALRDARIDAAEHWRAVAGQHAQTAFNTIHQLMTDPQTPPSVRLKAALYILAQATQPPAPPTPDELEREHEIRRRQLLDAEPDSAPADLEPECPSAEDAARHAELDALEAAITLREGAVTAREQRLATDRSSQFNTSPLQSRTLSASEPNQTGRQVRQFPVREPSGSDT